MKITNGWVDEAQRVPSPNFNARPVAVDISLLIIHNISLPPGQFEGDYVEQFFQNCLDCSLHPYFETIRDLEVSSHFLIKRDGQLVQFVSTEDRAWHAGKSVFEGVSNCNDFAIGIELSGCDDQPYSSAQYKALADLTERLQQAYPGITQDRIVGHSDVAPGRKTDPGEAFEWSRYFDLLGKRSALS